MSGEFDRAAAASALHVGIVSARFFETWEFYTSLLGFRTVDENDGYVRLAHACGAEISVLQHELNGDWAELVNATDARGFWLRLELEDPEAEYVRLCTLSVTVERPARGAKWRATSFVLRDPNGVLIFVGPQCTKAEVLAEEFAEVR